MVMIPLRRPHRRKPSGQAFQLNNATIPYRDKLFGLWIPENLQSVVNLAQRGNGDLLWNGVTDPAAIRPSIGRDGKVEQRVVYTEGNFNFTAYMTGITGFYGALTVISRVNAIELRSGRGWLKLGGAYNFISNPTSSAWGMQSRRATTTLDANAWYTLGVNRDPAANELRFYLDGKDDGSDSMPSGSAGTQVTLGTSGHGTGGNAIDNEVSWVMVYLGVAFSAAEHAQFQDPTYFYRTFLKPQTQYIPTGTTAAGVTGVIPRRISYR